MCSRKSKKPTEGTWKVREKKDVTRHHTSRKRVFLYRAAAGGRHGQSIKDCYTAGYMSLAHFIHLLRVKLRITQGVVAISASLLCEPDTHPISRQELLKLQLGRLSRINRHIVSPIHPSAPSRLPIILEQNFHSILYYSRYGNHYSTIVKLFSVAKSYHPYLHFSTVSFLIKCWQSPNSINYFFLLS